tara:strand:+ start:332 stop:871 length:540 start_codon:yes stop_codon:yes gene_type:complete
MLQLHEVRPHEVIKVLVEFDEVEEELYAKVLKNDGSSLVITYLTPTSKIYKGACVYSFDSTVERVTGDSITEHHAGTVDIVDIDMTQVGKNMFVLNDEIRIECDSEIEDETDEDEYESDFVVSDDDCATPRTLGIADCCEVDKTWNEWQPSTSGGKHFKNIIDSIECRIRHRMDEQNFV